MEALELKELKGEIEVLKDQMKVMLDLLQGKAAKAEVVATPASAATSSVLPNGTAAFSGFKSTKLDFRNERRRETSFDILVDQKSYGEVTKVQEIVSYQGPTLEKLELRAVLKFCNEVQKHQARTGRAIQMACFVADDIKLDLEAQSEGRISAGSFYSTPTDVLLMEIQRAIRPSNPASFLDTLKKNTGFRMPKDYSVRPTSLHTFYNALLVYRNDFVFVYNFLAEENSDNVPPLGKTEGGVLHVFVSKIPFRYGFKIMATKTIQNKNYDKLELFLDDFFRVATGHKKLSNALRDAMCYFVFEKNEKGGATYYKRSTEDNAIVVLAPESEDNLGAYELGDDGDAAELEDVGDQMVAYTEQKKPNTNTEKHDISKMACFQMVYKGTCSSASCRFSHERPRLEKAWMELSKLLEKSPYRTPSKLGYLGDTEDLNEVHENLFYAIPESAVRGAANTPAVILMENRNISLPAKEVLFDTGAYGDNFISEAFYEEHEAAFSKLTRSKITGVTVASGEKIGINKELRLNIMFTDSKGGEHCISTTFLVLRGLPVTIIIGINDIVKKLLPLFFDMIQTAADRTNLAISNLQEPWTGELFSASPEEENTEDPCSFSHALHFMEMTQEEAQKEYIAQFEEHVDPNFLEYAGVRKLLETIGLQVFVPANWNGISGIDELEFTWKESLPDTLKPKTRPVNPRLFQHAKMEFQRLLGYFYRLSTSPIASCLVIAPKATKPFIRFCGDYVEINRHIERGHHPIPIVKKELAKIISFPIYLDIDLTNAFHQIKLGPITSKRLSVQTPWGQVEPLFMPEGVSPATGVLQKVVSSIFQDFEDFTICIFDNLLVLAHDYADARDKLHRVLERCRDRNVVLKFAKSWLGFRKVHFFGYDCQHKSFAMSKDRKEKIKAFPMPSSVKQMQSFLGSCVYFAEFVPNYSQLAAGLHDMCKTGFSWDKDTWTYDYVADFERFKSALTDAFSLYYPDYGLDWILRTDASDVGVGAVLLQIAPQAAGESQQQPIAFSSQKFSDQARRWSTFEKEAYGVYFGVKYFEYFLRCREFVIETDHRNLTWIENSVVPKVIRWRIFLQGFNFKLRHIPGSKNLVADWQSRFFALTSISELPGDVKFILSQVHGGRAGHHGERRTWALLNRSFPGHHIPYRLVAEFVLMCPVCQKDRLGMLPMDTLPAITRHLKVDGNRSVVGVDTLTITPPDRLGNKYLVVLVNHFTKFTALYPTADKTAITLARALMQYFATYGLVEKVLSDPGSDLMSKVVAQLNRWLGVTHTVSLVDRHESNGVEPTNKAVLRHLKALVYDERFVESWSEPEIVCWVQIMLNNLTHSETGFSPYELTFGSTDAAYFKVPGPLDELHPDIFLKMMDNSLQRLRAKSRIYQQNLVRERTKKNPIVQTLYKPGDFVLVPNRNKSSKLQPNYEGPFEVIAQHKNDVQVKNIIRGDIKTIHVERLKIFHGNAEEALKMAQLDNDEFVIDSFLAYKGEPLKRLTMSFLVRFADGSEHWLDWSQDLFSTIQYEAFCSANRELWPLLHPSDEVKKACNAVNATPIIEVAVGDLVYVDLRCYGAAWYDTLPLPDKYTTKFMVEYKYLEFNKSGNKVKCYCKIFEEYFMVNRDFVQRYGNVRILPSNAILIDEKFIEQYPMVLPKKQHITALNIILINDSEITLISRTYIQK